MSDPLDSFNAVVGDLNHASSRLGVYREDWGGLPAGVKNALKVNTIELIDQAITDLGAVKVEIQNL